MLPIRPQMFPLLHCLRERVFANVSRWSSLQPRLLASTAANRIGSRRVFVLKWDMWRVLKYRKRKIRTTRRFTSG